MSIESSSLVLAVSLSWGIWLLLCVIGEISRPFGQRYRDVPPKKFKRPSVLSRQRKTAIWLFGNHMAFPKFHAVLFFFIPACVAIVSEKALEDGAEHALFFDTPEAQKLIIPQILLWESVYCFCGCMFSNFLWFSQSIPSSWHKEKFYHRFPIQYNEKMCIQFALIGICLLLGSTIAAVKVETNEIPENSNLLHLQKASVWAPFALLTTFGYKGLFSVLDVLDLGSLPTNRSILYFLHLIAVGFILSFTSRCNQLAKWILFMSLIFLVLAPIVFWLASSRRAHFPEQAESPKRLTFEYSKEPGVEINLLKVNFFSKQTAIGVKHWLWAPWRPYLLPVSGFIDGIHTESDISIDMFFIFSEVSILSFFDNWECLAFVFCPVICLTFLIQVLWNLKGDLRSNIITDHGKLGTMMLSPPTGRSVFKLLDEWKFYMFFVDPPGYPAALAYFSQYAQDAAMRNSSRRALFIFHCPNFTDYCTVLHGLSSVLQEFGKGYLKPDLIDFMILVDEKTPTIELVDRPDMLRTPPFLEMIEMKIGLAPYFDFLDFSVIASQTEAPEINLVAIGSSYLNVITMELAKSISNHRACSVFEVVFEDSLFRLPEQM